MYFKFETIDQHRSEHLRQLVQCSLFRVLSCCLNLVRLFRAEAALPKGTGPIGASDHECYRNAVRESDYVLYTNPDADAPSQRRRHFVSNPDGRTANSVGSVAS